MLFDFNLHSGLLLPFAVQGVAAAAVLAWRGWRDDSLHDRLLSILLLLLTLSIGQWLLGYAGWYDAHDRYTTLMFYLPWTNSLALGPLFYAYFRALTDQRFTLRGFRRHLAPALVLPVLCALAFIGDRGTAALTGRPLPDFYGTRGVLGAALQQYGLVFDLVGYASLFYYGARTLRAFRAYQEYLNANFSDTARLRFNWIRRLLLAALGALGVWLGLSVAGLAGAQLGFDGWWYAFFTTGLLIYYLSFAGLQTGGTGRPALLFPFGDAAETTVAPPVGAETTLALYPAEPPIDTADPTALPAELAEYLPQLRALMTTDQPWREPELTLADLALRLHLAPALLSRLINAGAGQHFNDFVNTYRVAEAARLLRAPTHRHYTLLAVALEAGFNSKSTFNRVFKKLNDLTPSEFAAGPSADL